jgi:hypothetical protein
MDAALALCEQAHYVPPVSSSAASGTSSNISTTASTKQAGTGSGSSTAACVNGHADAADDTVAMHVDTADSHNTSDTTATNSNAAKTSAATKTVKLRCVLPLINSIAKCGTECDICSHTCMLARLGSACLPCSAVQ